MKRKMLAPVLIAQKRNQLWIGNSGTCSGN
jgi:hypothetical protein